MVLSTLFNLIELSVKFDHVFDKSHRKFAQFCKPCEKSTDRDRKHRRPGMRSSLPITRTYYSFNGHTYNVLRWPWANFTRGGKKHPNHSWGRHSPRRVITFESEPSYYHYHYYYYFLDVLVDYVYYYLLPTTWNLLFKYFALFMMPVRWQ